MTLTAQQSMIFGALCMDEEFRTDLFTPPPDGQGETPYQKVTRVVSSYARSNEVTIDPSVMQNVMNIVQSNSPCRGAALEAFRTAKASVCPCWPC